MFAAMQTYKFIEEKWHADICSHMRLSNPIFTYGRNEFYVTCKSNSKKELLELASLTTSQRML